MRRHVYVLCRFRSVAAAVSERRCVIQDAFDTFHEAQTFFEAVDGRGILAVKQRNIDAAAVTESNGMRLDVANPFALQYRDCDRRNV